MQESGKIKACPFCFIQFDDINKWNDYNVKIHESHCSKNPFTNNSKAARKAK